MSEDHNPTEPREDEKRNLGGDLPNEEVLDDAIKELKQVENWSLSQIDALETKSTTIYSFLVGGSGIFTSLLALISLLNSSGLGIADPIFYQFIARNIYINIGIVFFITSIGFALLGSSNHVVAHGIQAQNVKEIRENNGLTKTELKKMLLTLIVPSSPYASSSGES
ncbi:hypothetical protein [Halostagnicola sp. A56]|uniref:hypothetical protein n=1 Tax=Halostagnicola sp. A56 TaxID=1495067 RepID=UPI0012E285C7|nr:hypothetical protein [Halostagnicola sp. A56]